PDLPIAPPPASRPAGAPPTESLDPAAQELFQRLRAWRTEEARSRALPAYIIMSDLTLRALAARRPQSRDALLAVPGIGPAKAEEYGAALLDILNSIDD